MKKLIFLLIMALAFVGMVSAIGAADPPGAYSLEMAEIIMAEYSVQQGVVTQPSVLVLVTPVMAEPSSLQAVLANDNFIAIQSQSGFVLWSNFIMIEKQAADADYYLRC